MKEVIDVIVIGLFVLFMIFLVAGFNRNAMEKHKKRMEEK